MNLTEKNEMKPVATLLYCWLILKMGNLQENALVQVIVVQVLYRKCSSHNNTIFIFPTPRKVEMTISTKLLLGGLAIHFQFLQNNF